MNHMQNESWTMVYAGSYASVIANQATLEASGIRTFIPDSTTKVLDPMITGGACMNAELHVHISNAEHASEILQVKQSSSPERLTTAQFIASDPVTRNVLIALGLILVALVLFLSIAEF
jgi:hypothetical protein